MIRFGLRVTIAVSFIITLSLESKAQQNPETRREILVYKNGSGKKHKIQIYPDAQNRGLFFYASGAKGKVYQLFLFDLNGHLVKQAHIRHKQTAMLNKIDKGTYLFEVFSDDERVETGKVEVN
jgi:hypothetical protein